MIKIFFNVMLSILTSLIQIIVYPINVIIISILPDLSDKIVEVSQGITTLFSGVAWGIGALPQTLIATLLFIVSVEIAKYSIYISTHVITLVLSIIKRLKFW